ncbi:hypothetical protein K469DRAFT_701419, partial [Zopfia rhizophila CBS 207.26]
MLIVTLEEPNTPTEWDTLETCNKLRIQHGSDGIGKRVKIFKKLFFEHILIATS